MIPSARKLIAVPEMIWSTFRWIAQIAWIVASTIPASAAHIEPDEPRRSCRPSECAQIAPQMPKNAPVRSIPSSATLITPLRSQKRPPIAA